MAAKSSGFPDTNTAGATYQPRGYVIETDQGKLLGLLPQNSMDLENVSLVPFYTSSYINLNTLDDSVQAETTLGDGGVLRRRGEPELGRNLFRRRELQRD
mgnify:CR=1 FL=1